jgi:hypothetical protein
VDFKKAKITQRVAQKRVGWFAVVRLNNGNVVCGGSTKTILLFDKQFKEVNSKSLSGTLLSAILVDNYVYCGLSDGHVVVFGENLN